MKTKICTKCKKEYSTEATKYFSKDKLNKDGLRNWCKKCDQAHRKRTSKARAAYNHKHRRDNKMHYRDYNLQRNYGITLDDYQRMLADQDGVCAICDQFVTNKHAPCLLVDHDHRTGKIRGLLCAVCNTRLAIIEDEEFVKRARQYLKNS